MGSFSSWCFPVPNQLAQEAPQLWMGVLDGVICSMAVEVNFQASLMTADGCSLAEPGMTLLMALPG